MKLTKNSSIRAFLFFYKVHMSFRSSGRSIIKKILAVFCVFFIVGTSEVFAGSTPVYLNNPIVAEVDGKPIYLDELKHIRIQEALKQIYEMQTRALKEKILDKLADKHPSLVAEQPPKVTQVEIKKFYDSNPGIKELGNISQVSGEIRDYLEKSFQQVHVERLYQNAVQKGWVKVYLKPPNDFRLVAGLGTAMVWAEEKSPSTRRVFVLEYSDFQCPFCKRVQSTLEKVRKKYSNEVQFGYRHFPLPFHKEAHGLAQAVECARDQDKFWELQDLFYKNISNSANDKEVLDLAKLAGVENIRDFEFCWHNGKYAERVKNDISDAAELGIQGTPTFILGAYDPETQTVSGEMFSGAVSEEKFVRVIEKYLASTRIEAKLNQ
ncbi:thioredoxin domain-containing protein [Nitrospinae bacterium]|nr:thioredoxin domain-containing protein [Nitrospinota bacterium]